jgi:hypothetical protein
MSKVKRTSTYESLQWARKLLKSGYKTFSFTDLPEDLHIWAYHRKAISKGYIQKTGYKIADNGIRYNVYIVLDEVMTINHHIQPM